MTSGNNQTALVYRAFWNGRITLGSRRRQHHQAASGENKKLKRLCTASRSRCWAPVSRRVRYLALYRAPWNRHARIARGSRVRAAHYQARAPLAALCLASDKNSSRSCARVDIVCSWNEWNMKWKWRKKWKWNNQAPLVLAHDIACENRKIMAEKIMKRRKLWAGEIMAKMKGKRKLMKMKNEEKKNNICSWNKHEESNENNGKAK